MWTHKVIVLIGLTWSQFLPAANYAIDVKGAHASIEFRVKHLGYSWLTGRFNTFTGDFSYDANDLANSQLELTITTTSIDTNHALRDKHLRGKDFLDVAKFPKAKFTSTKFESEGELIKVYGNFQFRGIAREIVIDAYKVGEGDDPWGGYRIGFTGTTHLYMKDFDIKKDLGQNSQTIELDLNIEGVLQASKANN